MQMFSARNLLSLQLVTLSSLDNLGSCLTCAMTVPTITFVLIDRKSLVVSAQSEVRRSPQLAFTQTFELGRWGLVMPVVANQGSRIHKTGSIPKGS
ncbi:hypothetical protein CC78DRAFT_91418 [Lojkania enalia]|uniref:Uncharacterized protein n=1 Tax=Lojkania enalia TaxID=147567 RepID=A0A9P4KED0_9PLEO|nr:hypothetical protein CC78DRAFT_91418 [Didymosphaeria enalia]